MEIKVSEWSVKSGLFDVFYPGAFGAKIDPNMPLADLLKETVEAIKLAEGAPGCRTFIGDTRIPYNNYVIDEANKVFAFVLLDEKSVIGGRSWKEVIYGFRVMDSKLQGWAICFGSNSYVNREYSGQHYRMLVNKIVDGRLFYKHKNIQDDDYRQREIDLVRGYKRTHSLIDRYPPMI